jgi:hypothetical protein
MINMVTLAYDKREFHDIFSHYKQNNFTYKEIKSECLEILIR